MTTIHVVSATAIVTPDGTHQLAMCGTDMGPYENIPADQVIGNYASAKTINERVTCPRCLERTPH